MTLSEFCKLWNENKADWIAEPGGWFRHKNAVVAADAIIGFDAIVYDDAVVGDRARVGADAVVGARARVGADAVVVVVHGIRFMANWSGDKIRIGCEFHTPEEWPEINRLHGCGEKHEAECRAAIAYLLAMREIYGEKCGWSPAKQEKKS
jgi:hypothetical protein